MRIEAQAGHEPGKFPDLTASSSFLNDSASSSALFFNNSYIKSILLNIMRYCPES